MDSFLKIKSQLYAAYGKFISGPKTYIGSKWKDDIPEKKKIQNKAGVALLTLDKKDFRPKRATRDKESHYTVIKWSSRKYNSCK